MSENPLGKYHRHRITSITYRPYSPNIFKEKDLKNTIIRIRKKNLPKKYYLKNEAIMSERVATKKVVQFARREYKEKRPLSVKVARAKPETIFSTGFLSSTKITRRRLSTLIVIAEYRTYYRIYSFTKTARLLGAENIDSTPDFRKKLTKSTKTIYSLPKHTKK